MTYTFHPIGLVVLVVLWYVPGVAVFLSWCWESGGITARDIMRSAGVGLVGPFLVFVWASDLRLLERLSRLLDVVLFERRIK